MKNTENFRFQDLGRISYQEALVLQTAAFEKGLEAKREIKAHQNRLFFCEHNPVITIGKSGKEANLLISAELLEAKGIELYRVERGGDITYHGPGQITGYPVFDLDSYHMGLKQYIDTLESVVIDFLSLYDISAGRLPSATGVWIEPEFANARKICAIGVKSSRFITMHGFALNIYTDLSHFQLMNPCGFVDKGVTSLEKELGFKPDFDDAKQLLLNCFRKYF